MRRISPALAVLTYLGAATIVVAHTVAKMNVPGEPQPLQPGMADFRDASYFPVVSLLEGDNPYDVPHYLATRPVVNRFPLYSPVTLLLHLPFGLLPQREAQYTHLAINLLLVLVLARVALRVASLDGGMTLVFGLAALVLLSQPGQRAIFVGQSSVYLVIGVYLALHFARSRPWLAATGLAVACAKPTFGVPVAFLMLWRGDWRAVSRGAGIAALVSAGIGVLLVRSAGGMRPLLASVRDNYGSWGGQSHSTKVAESVHRLDAFLLGGRLIGRPLHGAEDFALTLPLFALAAWTVWRISRRDDQASRSLTMVVICLATLTGTYHQLYDALVLTLPALLVASGQWDAVGGLPGRRARVPLLVALAIPAANYLATFPIAGALSHDGLAFIAITTVNAAAILTGFLIVVVVGLRRASGDDTRAHARLALASASSAASVSRNSRHSSSACAPNAW